MRTELFFIALVLVQLLNSRMCIFALLSAWAFTPIKNCFAHDIIIEISKPLMILLVVIIDTLFMKMGLGVGTWIKFKVVKVQILT